MQLVVAAYKGAADFEDDDACRVVQGDGGDQCLDEDALGPRFSHECHDCGRGGGDRDGSEEQRELEGGAADIVGGEENKKRRDCRFRNEQVGKAPNGVAEAADM